MLQIPPKETLTTEFKSDRNGYSDENLVSEIVGIANTEGGIIYLGVEDNGEITGLNPKHTNTDGLEAMVANKTIPPVYIRAEVAILGDKKIVCITIPKCRNIIATSDGRMLRRRLKMDGAPENIPMYPYEIPGRLSSMGLIDCSAQILEDAVMEDLDKQEIARMRDIIKERNGERILAVLTDEELLLALQLVKKESDGQLYPTVAGLLMVGKETSIEQLLPTARATFQVLTGTKVRKNEEYCKPLLATIELFEEYLKSWNPETETEYGFYRVGVPEFSETAFREGLVNALCHRDYTILQPVRVAIEDEGLTISNPGGFIEGVTLNNLLTVEPRGRNQALANAIKRLGLAEKTGRGIDRIFEGSVRYGKPLPDYSETTATCVKLFIQRAKPDFSFMKVLSEEEKKTGNLLSINTLLILSALRRDGKLSAQELEERTNISSNRISLNIENLLDSGMLETIGSGKTLKYMLRLQSAKSANGKDSHGFRVAERSGESNEELVLELAASQNGTVTREDVMKMLGLSGPKAYRLLQKLVKAGEIEGVGSGRGAYYKKRRNNKGKV